MALKFDGNIPPPTLSRRRSKQKIDEILSRKYDVRKGLRDVGGYLVTNEDLDERRLNKERERLRDENYARYGPIAPGWSYITEMELAFLFNHASDPIQVTRKPMVTVDISDTGHFLIRAVVHEPSYPPWRYIRYLAKATYDLDPELHVKHYTEELNRSFAKASRAVFSGSERSGG